MSNHRRPMKARTTALVDQADAAGAEATRILHALAAMRGDRVDYRLPGPMFAAIVGQLGRRLLAGQVTLCPHLSCTAPRPSFWCPWAPGRLRCSRCADAAQRRIHGTREDRRCDHCRRIAPSIHAAMTQLPPVVVDLPEPWQAKCLPPITVIFGLCPTCHQAEAVAKPKETA